MPDSTSSAPQGPGAADHLFEQGDMADDVCRCGRARFRHPGERGYKALYGATQRAEERWPLTIYVCALCGAGYRNRPRDICIECGTEAEKITPTEVVPLSRALQAEAEAERIRKATERGIEKIRDAYKARPSPDDPAYDYTRWLEYTLHARTEERNWRIATLREIADLAGQWEMSSKSKPREDTTIFVIGDRARAVLNPQEPQRLGDNSEQAIHRRGDTPCANCGHAVRWHHSNRCNWPHPPGVEDCICAQFERAADRE